MSAGLTVSDLAGVLDHYLRDRPSGAGHELNVRLTDSQGVLMPEPVRAGLFDTTTWVVESWHVGDTFLVLEGIPDLGDCPNVSGAGRWPNDQPAVARRRWWNAGRRGSLLMPPAGG